MLNNIGTFQNANLTKTEIRESLSGRCDIGDVETVTEIGDGVNAAAFLQTDTGDDYFIKFNTFSPTLNLFHAQPFILSYLDSTDNRFNVPSPVGYDFTRNDIRHEWYLTEVVNGETFDNEKEDTPIEKIIKVGEVLGNINSISVNGVGYSTPKKRDGTSCSVEPELSFEKGSWEEYLKEEMHKLVNTSDNRFGSLRKPIHDFIENNPIREVNPHLTHFDYWWENILWKDETPYIIDWERSVGGDPVANRFIAEHYFFDIVSLKSDVFSDKAYNNEKELEKFRDAYTSAYTGSQNLDINTKTHRMYTLLIYVREMRGFPYWWRNKSAEWTQKRKEALYDCVTDIVQC